MKKAETQLKVEIWMWKYDLVGSWKTNFCLEVKETELQSIKMQIGLILLKFILHPNKSFPW